MRKRFEQMRNEFRTRLTEQTSFPACSPSEIRNRPSHVLPAAKERAEKEYRQCVPSNLPDLFIAVSWQVSTDEISSCKISPRTDKIFSSSFSSRLGVYGDNGKNSRFQPVSLVRSATRKFMHFPSRTSL